MEQETNVESRPCLLKISKREKSFIGDKEIIV